MWTKIQTDGQSRNLMIGTIVIEYPVSGRPVEDINFRDIKNLNSFQVVLTNPLTGEIDLSLPVMENSDQQLMTKGVAFSNFADQPVLHKYFEDLKEESIWWIEQ
jgi:hypothetical protein